MPATGECCLNLVCLRNLPSWFPRSGTDHAVFGAMVPGTSQNNAASAKGELLRIAGIRSRPVEERPAQRRQTSRDRPHSIDKRWRCEGTTNHDRCRTWSFTSQRAQIPRRGRRACPNECLFSPPTERFRWCGAYSERLASPGAGLQNQAEKAKGWALGAVDGNRLRKRYLPRSPQNRMFTPRASR